MRDLIKDRHISAGLCIFRTDFVHLIHNSNNNYKQLQPVTA